MSQEVETKVVQMRFDNKKFEKNIKTTIKSVKSLDQSLKFKGSKKEIDEIAKSLERIETKKINENIEKTDKLVNKLGLSIKDIVKIKVISKVVDGVTNRVTNLTKSILGINNVIAGWEKYEQQVTTVGGILNNVKREGLGLAEVAEVMDKLRWYTDETSFSFTTLSDGIKQFTTAGVELDKASKAAIGVTSLAGASKVFDAFKVQSAMDAVSKSLATGYVDVQKWTSLTNTAGIVTTEFSQALIDAAVAQGKLVKSTAGQYKTKTGGKLVTTENIRSTLSEKWLTGEVLSQALGRYSAGAEAVRNMLDQIEAGTAGEWVNTWMANVDRQYEAADMTVGRTIQLLDDMEKAGIYSWDRIGRDALLSSQQATSWSQVVQSAQEGVSSRFQQMFELIFGNTEEATILWSDMAEKFYDVFVGPLDSVTEMFKKWHDLTDGGYETFRDTLWTIVDVIDVFGASVREAFGEVFSDFNEEVIAAAIKTLNRWAHSLKNNEKLIEGFKNIVKVFATILKTVFKILGSGFKILGKLIKVFEPLLDFAVKIIDVLAEGILVALEWIDQMKIFDVISDGLIWGLEKIAGAFEWIGDGIKYAGEKLKNSKIIKELTKFVDKLKELLGLSKESKTFTQRVDEMKKSLKEFKEEFIKEWDEEIKDFKDTGFYKFLNTTFDIIKGLFKVIRDFFDSKFKSIKQKINEGSITVTDIIDAIKKILLAFLALQGIRAVTGITGTINAVRDTIWALEKKLRVGNLQIVASALLEFSAAIVVMSIAFEKLSKIDTKPIWKAMAIMTLVIAELIAMTFAISKFDFTKKIVNNNGKITKGTGFFQLMAAALALTILMKAVVGITDATKEMSWNDIGKTLVYIGGIGLIFAASVALMRVGGKMVSLWGLTKIIVSLVVVYKLLNSVIKTINETSIDDLKKAGGIVLTVIAGVTAAYVAIGFLSRIILSKSSGVLPSVTSGLLAIVGTIAIAVLVIKMASQLSQSEIERGYAVVSDLFIKVGLIAIGIGMFSKVVENGGILSIIRGGGTSIRSSSVGMTLLGITASVAMMLVLFKLLNNITRTEINHGEAIFIEISALLLGAYAVFVIINRFNSRIGMKNTKGLILSIVGSIVVMIAMIKALNYISTDEILSSLGKMILIEGTFALIYAVFSFIGSKNKVTVGPTIATMASIAGFLFAALGAIAIIKNFNENDLTKAAYVAGGIAVFVTVILALLTAFGDVGAVGVAILGVLAADIVLFAGALWIFTESIKQIDSNVLKNVTDLSLALSLLTVSAPLAATALPISLLSIGLSIKTFAKNISKLETPAVEAFSKVSDIISKISVPDEAVKSSENLKTFSTNLSFAAKKYKKNAGMEGLLADLQAFSIAFNSFKEINLFDENGNIISLSSDPYINYMNSILDIVVKMREISDKYEPLKNITRLVSDVELLFGSAIANGSLIDAVKNVTNVGGIENKESVINTIESLIDIMTKIRKVSNTNIADFKYDKNTGELLFGKDVRSLIENVAIGLKSVNADIANVDWSKVNPYIEAVSNIISAVSVLGVKGTSDFWKGKIEITEVNIPKGFGTTLASIVTEFAAALSSAKKVDFDKESADKLTEIMSAASELFAVVYNDRIYDKIAKDIDTGAILINGLTGLEGLESMLSVITSFATNSELNRAVDKEKLENAKNAVIIVTEMIGSVKDTLENYGFGNAGFFEWIGKIFSGGGNEYKNFNKALLIFAEAIPTINKFKEITRLDTYMLSNLPKFVDIMAESIRSLNNNSRTLSPTGVEKFFNLLGKNGISGAIDSITTDQNKISSFIQIMSALSSFVNGNIEGIGLTSILLAEINQLLDHEADLTPVIKPLWDFTEWDNGINKMKNDISLNLAYKTQAGYNQANGDINVTVTPTAETIAQGGNVQINNTFTFTDSMQYSYDATRSLSQMILNAEIYKGVGASTYNIRPKK